MFPINFTYNIQKKIFFSECRYFWAVGMHHWGARHLHVGAGYYLKPEPNNPADKNAIAIVEESGVVKAYLKRENAFIMSRLLIIDISPLWMLKPKEDLCVLSRRLGPQQRCNVGCKISEENLVQAKAFLIEQNIAFEIK